MREQVGGERDPEKGTEMTSTGKDPSVRLPAYFDGAMTEEREGACRDIILPGLGTRTRDEARQRYSHRQQ